MHPVRALRVVSSAVAAATAVLLVASATTATSLAAPASASALPAAAGLPTVPPAASPVSPPVHPVKDACAKATKDGWASCLAVVRTDVKAHKGLFAASSGGPAGYGPADLRSAYVLPSATAGSGQTVAVVDAYDNPSAESDLAVYRAQYGLPPCTTANGCFRKVSQDGGVPVNQDPTGGWEEEESLDLDMVSAICPNCHILLVEADDSSFANLGTAVNEAVALGAKYVSNSYGGPEDPSDLTADAAYYSHPGVAITASSGDSGYGAQYPAASPDVTAVGGTTLVADPGSARGWAETAWMFAGSGCSAYEPKPSWQKDSGCANRTVADVSAVADPDTGVAVYDSFLASGWSVFGGTSVASPIIASTYALAGSPAAGSNPASYPYADPAALNDITSGDTSDCTPAYLCTAGPGYDGPTGLGTPDGVAAFTTGPHGVVSGTVRDASTGHPVADAEVGIGQFPAVYTGSSGGYTLTVPAGTYPVTVKDFTYATQNASTVQVTDGQTTTQNFALQPLPTATVTGTVTDGSGHGWPLYAKVSVPGTPAATYTNPVTGKYSLTLPLGGTFTVETDAVYPGYEQVQRTIQTSAAALTQDVSVPVNASSCSAAGYQYSYDGATQTFDGSTAPAGWSVVNASGTTYGWEFDDPGGLPNDTGGSGNFAVADSYNHNLAAEHTYLVSPVVDMSQDATPIVQFNSDLITDPYSYESIDVSIDGGQTWTTVLSNSGVNEAYLGPQLDALPLPMAAGKSDVQVRFQYWTNPYGGFGWELDNVFLGNRSCAEVPGGLVEGTVTDGNTRVAVNGATVTSSASTSQQATTMPTPDDPARHGGFYDLFVPGTGTQQISAALPRYVTATVSANVTADAVTKANLILRAGRLSVSPATISKSVPIGGSTTQNVSFKNTGGAPVTVTLYAEPGGFTPSSQAKQSTAGARSAASNPAPRVMRGTFSPLSPLGAHGAVIQGRPAMASGPAGSSSTPWTSVQNYPTPIMDNMVATDPATGLVYSVGGFDGTQYTAAGYVYDPRAGTWTALPPMPQARDAGVAAFINGKLYVAAGWGILSNGTPILLQETDIYDPSTGTWSTGADDPLPYAGASAAVLDGKMYVIGGCLFSTCGVNTVSVYDPASDSWSSAASYPESISWEGCGTITGEIYCAGGYNGTEGIKRAYVYNPASDSWSAIAPMPIDLMAAGYTAANGELLISGGVTNDLSEITSQGYAYSPSAGSWRALPDSGDVDYRGGSACGLYRIGGSIGTEGFAARNLAEQLPGYAACGTATVPWLSEGSDTFTLQPGERVTITVTLNAADPSVTQPGVYTAALGVTSDTPYQDGQVGVTMKVLSPKS